MSSWNQTSKSNEFNITINPALPSAQTNEMNTIYVYANHYIQAMIPENLFSDINGGIPIYTSSNWIDNNIIKIATRIFADYKSGKYYIFVKVYGEIGCQISIFNENSFCQTSETKVNITVLKWASKDCFECSGPYESNWVSWNTGFVISNDGSWVSDSSFLPISNVKLYWIWGLFAMTVTFIHILLTIKYGKFMLKPAIHIQSLIMLVFSSDCVSDDWREYFSWIHMFKFDFGFLNPYWSNHIK